MAYADGSGMLLRVLSRRRWLALSVFLVVLGLGALVSYLLPTKYTSSMRILIRAAPTDLRATAARADGAQVGQVTEEEVNSEVEFLTSYDLLRKAVVENNLSHAAPSSDPARSVDAATRRLGAELGVTAVRKANIIEVQYSASTPKLAASVLRSIESGYLEAHQRAQSTPGGYRFFQGEMEYYRNKFAEKQQAFAQFTDSQDTANLDQQLTLLTKTISDQEAALQQAQAEVAELRSEIEKSTAVVGSLSARIDTTRKSVPNQSVIDHLTTLLADLEARRIQQVSKFRNDDPLVKETDNEIAMAKAELRDAGSLTSFEVSTDVNPTSQSVDTSLANRRVQLAGLESKVRVLGSQILANRSRVNHLTDASGKYRMLQGDVQNAQDDYNNYVQRQENARVSESLDENKISNVVVAQQPTESVLPVSSHRLLVLAFSFLVAIFASVASCMLAEASGRSYLLHSVS